MTSWNDFVDSLIENEEPIAVRKNGEWDRIKHTCEACNGSGLWSARRTNRHGNDKCNACNGRGYFVTSKADRLKATESRRARKAAADAKAREALADHLEAAAPGLLAFLKEAASWSDFAASLHGQALQRGLSDKQIAAASSMRAKCETRARKEAERNAAKVDVDLSAIEKMFATAIASGYKKPAYRAAHLRIKPNNGGGLAVYNEERLFDGMYGPTPAFEGKIVNGAFEPHRNAADNTVPALQEIAKDPMATALAYGRRTGRCSCCGRELTKHSSIEAGIGPICAEKWGL